MSDIPAEFANVTALAKANIYFDGKVVSHSIVFGDGTKKTLGLIYPGSYHFGTAQAERMEIVAGNCSVKLDGLETTTPYSGGEFFEVPANSGFQIAVPEGICEVHLLFSAYWIDHRPDLLLSSTKTNASTAIPMIRPQTSRPMGRCKNRFISGA